MSVEDVDFPLPVKVEEDQKLFIDLDSEENTPEDIVIEWHLEIRRFFGNHSAVSSESNLISIMKEYITSLTERAIHFEHVKKLHLIIGNHIEHIYWLYQDLGICYSERYLDYMEHIMTFYVNLNLRVLLVMKKQIKVTQDMVNDTTQNVIKKLSFYLLRSEYHIFHVLIRQTSTLVDGMIKDVMNILNSNICKQMFRNLYKHFLVLTSHTDMSEEAFCRAFILFENWKAFENYKHNEKIEKCMENIFNRDRQSIKESEFLSGILMPQTSIMSELMKVMGCDPSITKAYFDHIKSKQELKEEAEKVELEMIDDIGKLDLEDVVLSDTESIQDEDESSDFENEYIDVFEKIMEDTEYNLKDIVLDCKNEKNSTEAATNVEDADVLVLDTDSDSDVEIVSITPSQNASKQVSNSLRWPRNPVASTPTTTSFLESISVDADSIRRKYSFRNGFTNSNFPPKKSTDTIQATTPDTAETPINIDDDDDISMAPENIINDNDENQPTNEFCHVNIVQADTSGSEISKPDNTSTDLENSGVMISNVFNDLPMEMETSQSGSNSDVYSADKSANSPKVVEVSSSSNISKDNFGTETAQSLLMIEASPNVPKTSQVPIAVQTNGTINHVCRCSQILRTLDLSDDRSAETFPTISSTTSESMKVVTVNKPSSEESSQNNIAEEITSGNTLEVSKDLAAVEGENSVYNEVVATINYVLEKVSSVLEVPKESSENTEIEEVATSRSISDEAKEKSCSDSSESEIISKVDETRSIKEVGNGNETFGVESHHLIQGGNELENPVTRDEQTETQSISNEGQHVEMADSVENEGDDIEMSLIGTENVIYSIPLEKHLDALSIGSEKSVKPKKGFLSPSVKVKEFRENGTRTKDSELDQKNDRTLKCDENPLVSECRTEHPSVETERCENGCGEESNILSYSENDETIHRVGSHTEAPLTDESPQSITPLDTGQDHPVQPLDTGQFEANSPASPDDVVLKSTCDKNDLKMLRVVGEPLLRKGQPHGEFGYPTPPGSEEEREKDSDEQTQLIYSSILPTQTFVGRGNADPQNVEPSPTPKGIPNEDFLEKDCPEIENADTQLLETFSDEERELNRTSTPSLGKSYAQLVKDTVGSQNSTKDEDEETTIISEKFNKDQDISFEEMELFLKSCDEEKNTQTNRRKRKRPRDKSAEDNRTRKNSFSRSPKRVKINEKPETYIIPTSHGEEDEVWDIQNGIEYESSSSSDNEDIGSNRIRPKVKRRPSPMPLSKYLSKRNGTSSLIPSPPPLKGILKRIKQNHIYHPLHPVDDEPETVVIVLHQREIGRGKRGSVEVKVYGKSFTTFKIPFDDYKLCHHAFVKVDRVDSGDLDVWRRVSDRMRDFEEELINQPEKPMYKIVFDKNTPQLNSNDRKYYCDPSIQAKSSAITKPKSTLYESENEQGTVNLSTEIAYIRTPDQEPAAEPTIPIPISPPYFSPSSNSSSEFSDPTNFIPYQDIERALLVVEPDKSDTRGFNVECQDPAENIEKSIDLETIELLSNNADFHKMLRDMNGEVLVEKVSLIDIEEAVNLGRVVAIPGATSGNSDLVSNLNSDEQLLKKLCQELESEALVDNLTQSSQNPLILTDSLLEVTVEENCLQETTLVETAEEDIQVSRFSTVPNDSFSMHVSHSPIPKSAIQVTYSEPGISTLNAPIAASGYSTPMISPIPTSLHEETYSSVPDLSLARSSYSDPTYTPQTFSPKHSPPILSPLTSFHQDLYATVPHYTSNVSSYSDRNFTVSNQTPLERNAGVPSTTHENVYSSISSLHTRYSESNFSVVDSTSLSDNSSPIIPFVPNSLNERTYSVPDSSLIHSGYSEMHASVASPQLKLPIYSASNPLHSVEMKSFIPNPSVAVPLYPESLVGSSTSAVFSYPQSSSASASSSFGSNVRNVPPSIPPYPDANCLKPNVPSYPERKSIVPSPPLTVSPYSKSISAITTSQQMHTIHQSSYIPSLPSTSKCSPNPKTLKTTSRHSNRSVSKSSNPTPPKTPQEKTDKRRKRLPKEVLTISQLNDMKPEDSKVDNNAKCNSSIYTTEPKDLLQTRSKVDVGDSGRRLRKSQPTDYFNRNTRSTDPRVGQPLICLSPSSAQMQRSPPNFRINLIYLSKMRRRLRRRKPNVKIIKRIEKINSKISKVQGLKAAAAKKTVSKPKRSTAERSLPSPPKAVEPIPKIVYAVPISKPPQVTQSQAKEVSTSQNSPVKISNDQDLPKAPARKRGRPPKNSKIAGQPKSAPVVAPDIIPSTSSNIPSAVSYNVQVKQSQCVERVPPIYQPEEPPKRYPATRSATQPRVEPLKIVKDPNSKNSYRKVVNVKKPSLPMPVPDLYSFMSDANKNEVHAAKPAEIGDNEVEFETHLPLKKRKLSMPVPSTPPAQPTTLANVPRTREKKEEISYPATPMLSIADVYMQPRTFKTPAEKKQLPPESSNTVPPMRFETASDPQFNCGLSSYSPTMYGYGKCPYSVELDCNPYCPPPVLFPPPEPFSRAN